jgi:hypothetical protein
MRQSEKPLERTSQDPDINFPAQQKPPARKKVSPFRVFLSAYHIHNCSGVPEGINTSKAGRAAGTMAEQSIEACCTW